jgi:hypothetical protein
MASLANPFRTDDHETRLGLLRTQRDELAARLGLAETQLKLLRPWSWGRFLLGLAVPVVAAVGFLLMAVVVFGG